MEQLRTIIGAECRVIDKQPDNLLHLGFIALLFPNARVIHCRRDPRDTCLSCFFQKFSDGLPFTTNLADCGHRHVELERLAIHWRTVLPLRMLEINYERVVSAQETEIRRIIEFLDLEWEAACLDFHRAERPVLTASAWQVRRPLYSSSVGRWRHYEKHLAPLLTALKLETENDQA